LLSHNLRPYGGDVAKTYRNRRLTGVSFTRESRRLAHAAEGLYFQRTFAKTAEQRAAVERAIEANREASRALYEEYKAGR
jgi:hypothetical protein